MFAINGFFKMFHVKHFALVYKKVYLYEICNIYAL